MSPKPYKPSGIARWTIDDRPREKLFRLGPKRLSDSELLAIILRIGVKGKSAIDLAQEIKNRFKTWRSMADIDIAEWKRIKGLGLTKISQLIAAIEIGARIREERTVDGHPIKNSKQLAETFFPRLRDLKKEYFWTVLFDGRNKIRDEIEIAQGTATEVSTYTREIMATVIRGAAASFAVVHNHPTGTVEPSKSDKQLTRELVYAGQTLKVKLQDHIIIGDDIYYSFAEQGEIEKFEIQWVKNLSLETSGG
jgi:DNA repair protein RadC